ncbi:DNA polymerase iota-like [Anopheles albimanus]|uniref:UmuC domain-containing protein n=1 Tax=Anopheles albimanus TaxID=7167 RepID=A0A182FST1_ANOAL|nr:DNA polymerase iota-like [Anopheles albimanus]
MDGSQEAEDEECVHPRVIIHIDMDYFYAQVEEVLNPSLKDRPFAVKQRFCVVTSNYLARDLGIRKLQPVKEALAICPELVLVNGEDLTKYKAMSQRINEIMHRFTPHVEKLGLDENYLDVTELTAERLEQLDGESSNSNATVQTERVVGLIHPPPEDRQRSECSDRELFRSCCLCGCDRRLILATHIAQEIRECIFRELGLRCCAGIAHNKLLAKLVGSMNKPNKQTVLLPTASSSFVASLGSVRSLTGVGEKTAQTLAECCDVTTVTDLQQIELERLARHIGHEQAVRLKHIALGRDDTPVRQTGKPKSVGLEDSCPAISVRADAEEKFRHLLVRLVKNIAEDGRVPIAIKVTVRKYDSTKRTTHRESKQDKLLPSLFRHTGGKLVLAEGAQEKLLAIVMRVFERMVDLRQPFNITLLGLSFFKFQERRVGSKSIANFLIKKSDIEVQSITNLSNESITLSETSFCSNKSLTAMDCDPCGTGGGGSSDAGSLASLSGSESDVEPSPKKSRRFLYRGYRGSTDNAAGQQTRREDEATLSKLRVADLRLSSKDNDTETPQGTQSKPAHGNTSITTRHHGVSPMEVSSSGTSAAAAAAAAAAATKAPQPPQPPPVPPKESFFRQRLPQEVQPSTSCSTLISDQAATVNHSVQHSSTNLLPPNVDREVFHALPADVQQELLSNWRRAMELTASCSGNTTINASSTVGAHVSVSPGSSNTVTASVSAGVSTVPGSSPPAAAANASSAKAKNTLHRYFVKNT